MIAGTVTSAIGRKDAGSIVLERLRGSGVAGGHPISARLAQAMNAAGLNTRLYKNADDMKWSKLLTNLLANATSAILDMTPSEIFADPGLCQIEIAQLRETLQVMQAQGIQPVDLPGTPVRLLALASAGCRAAWHGLFYKKLWGAAGGQKCLHSISICTAGVEKAKWITLMERWCAQANAWALPHLPTGF